ncbi:hypothetical protein [Halorarum salinum]|uniref:Uncharacterized protein n=1 Tax=Halorarum salinum TaxID=2743089 RepID=A0A7D5Q8M6_9EURY|nr:hypothetical protein [Halobaculum salinum]QLG61077.1 hypothetical protein HUG12_04735 [Halobaculum salinum]
MSQSPDELPWHRGPAFWSFTDQTVIGHAATVVIGIGVFSAVYTLWLQLVAVDLTLLVSSHPGAASVRLAGLRAATIACYVWFSIAFMLGKGGPLRNYWLYPLVSLLTGVYLLPFALFQRVPADPLGADSVTFADAGLIVAVISVFGPGFLLGLGFTFGFIVVLTYVLETEDEWVDQHLPSEYRLFERAAPEETNDE